MTEKCWFRLTTFIHFIRPLLIKKKNYSCFGLISGHYWLKKIYTLVLDLLALMIFLGPLMCKIWVSLKFYEDHQALILWKTKVLLSWNTRWVHRSWSVGLTHDPRRLWLGKMLIRLITNNKKIVLICLDVPLPNSIHLKCCESACKPTFKIKIIYIIK